MLQCIGFSIRIVQVFQRLTTSIISWHTSKYRTQNVKIFSIFYISDYVGSEVRGVHHKCYHRTNLQAISTIGLVVFSYLYFLQVAWYILIDEMTCPCPGFGLQRVSLSKVEVEYSSKNLSFDLKIDSETKMLVFCGDYTSDRSFCVRVSTQQHIFHTYTDCIRILWFWAVAILRYGKMPLTILQR